MITDENLPISDAAEPDTGMLNLGTVSSTSDILQEEWKKIGSTIHNEEISLEQRIRLVLGYFLTHFVSLADPNLIDDKFADTIIYDISTSLLQVAIVNEIEEYEKMNPVVYGHAILSRIINDLHDKKQLSLSTYDLLQDWENRYGSESVS